ncbi:MAG: hypothetical protein WCF84_05435 [Anaerolineae bacterium]
MELLEIKSAFDLTAHAPATRREVGHSYLISTRQFTSVLANWRKPSTQRGPSAGRDATLSFMTLSADQIWITESEITSIEAAIRSARSPITLT